jgi:hypothetical protein
MKISNREVSKPGNVSDKWKCIASKIENVSNIIGNDQG